MSSSVTAAPAAITAIKPTRTKFDAEALDMLPVSGYQHITPEAELGEPDRTEAFEVVLDAEDRADG